MSAYPFSQVEAVAESLASRRVAIDAHPARADWRPGVGRLVLRIPKLAWMALDALLIAAGALLGQRLFVTWLPGATLLGDANLLVATAVLMSSIVLAGMMFGLYEAATLWERSRIAARSLLSIVVAMLTSCLVLNLLMYSQVSRRAALTGTAFYLVTAPFVRLAAHHAVVSVRRGLLLIGYDATIASIVRAVRRGAIPGYRLVGVVSDRVAALPNIPGLELIGAPQHAETICRDQDVREVVVAALADEHGDFARAALACLAIGCRVTDETTFYEKAFGEVPTSAIAADWFLRADLKGHLEEHATVKRAFDFTLAALVLAFSLPLWPVLMFAVLLESRGSIFYSQIRVGQSGRHFRIYKFRTMRADAEVNGSVWASPNDPRVTRIGRVLRRTRLDELPQLWNVLRGDMSLVGPRPERPEFVAPLSKIIPFYSERHLVKPGLTGWAQINFRYGASIADSRRKLQLDLYYVKNMCFELDLVICLRTFGMVLTGAC